MRTPSCTRLGCVLGAAPRPTVLLITTTLFLAFVAGSEAATGITSIDNNTNLTFYGDLRLRYEVDWDSHTAAGDPRDDRHRGRLRARAGLNYRFSDAWSAGVRLRTGDSRSQTSPHLTFVTDDGCRDEHYFVLDRYFVHYKDDRSSSYASRY